MPTFNTATDIPSLKDKVILVTGGNTGLGYEAIRALLPHGPAHVYLAARTASKATAAIESLHAVNPDVPITHLSLDLTSFASISAAATTFNAESNRLDILMLNAGIMAVPRGTTTDGFEIQLGTNHIGHFLLTKLLLPTLQATAQLPSADVRIVSLTSEGHNFARTGKTILSPKDLDSCGAWVRYGYSKLANILFTKEMAKRYPELTSIAVHPGVVGTDLFNTSSGTNPLVKVFRASTSYFWSTPQQGALNQVWAATTKKENVVSGGYYKPIGIAAKGSPCAQNDKLAADFWVWTEEQLKGKGY